MEHLDVFRTGNEDVGRRNSVDGIGVGVRTCLDEVLPDKVWEGWVADVLPKAVEGQGVFWS